MGIVVVARLAALGRIRRARKNDVGLQRDELGGQVREPVVSPLGVPDVDDEILAVDPPELPQGLTERLDGRAPAIDAWPARREEADACHPLRRLRMKHAGAGQPRQKGQGEYAVGSP